MGSHFVENESQEIKRLNIGSFTVKKTLGKYGCLCFLLFFFQIFYDLPWLVTLGKYTLMLFLFYFLWIESLVKASFRIPRLQISSLFIAYIFVLILSSLLNMMGDYYSLKEFLLGLVVISIPIGFYMHIVQQPSPWEQRKFCNDLQKGIVFGATAVLIYVSLTGSFTNYLSLGFRFMGENISPSIISLNATLLLSYSLIHMVQHKRYLFFIPISFAIILILLSLSKSGIVLGVFGFLYVAVVKRAYFAISVVSVVIGGLVIIFLPIETIQNVLFNYVTNDTLETLSGRSAIWQVCQELNNNKPLFGYGYNSVMKILPVYFTNFLAEQAHSVYYESMINVGVVGSSILGIYVLKVVIKCVRNFSAIKQDTTLSWFFFVVLIGLVRGVTEASFAQANNMIDVSLFFLSVFILDYFTSTRLKERKSVDKLGIAS